MSLDLRQTVLQIHAMSSHLRQRQVDWRSRLRKPPPLSLDGRGQDDRAVFFSQGKRPATIGTQPHCLP